MKICPLLDSIITPLNNRRGKFNINYFEDLKGSLPAIVIAVFPFLLMTSVEPETEAAAED